MKLWAQTSPSLTRISENNPFVFSQCLLTHKSKTCFGPAQRMTQQEHECVSVRVRPHAFSRSCRSWRPLASREHRLCPGATTVHTQRPSASWAEPNTCQPSRGPTVVCMDTRTDTHTHTKSQFRSILFDGHSRGLGQRF